ncbi:MAG: restriction endonuclease subunit S [Alphaproteobacteria bacterium]
MNKDFLLLSSEFNSVTRDYYLKQIFSNNVISDSFDLVTNTVNFVKDKVLLYDLTNSLTGFLQFARLVDEIDSSKKIVNKNDFIISRLRSYLKECAVVDDKNLSQIVSSEYLVFREKPNSVISSYTFQAFCLSRIVQGILSHSQYGTEHPRFFEFVLTNLTIPNSILRINKIISRLGKTLHNKIKTSDTLYKKAEEILINELGLKNFKPTNDNINIKKFSNSFIKTGRIDAEFYQKKYEDIENKIKCYKGGWLFLKDKNIFDLKRGSLISDNFYVKTSQRPYIRGADFSGGALSSGGMVYIDDNFIKTNETIVNNNDIIYALIGSVGEVALVTKLYNNSFISNNLGKLKIKNKNVILSEFLLIFLQSIGKYYFERYQMKTAQPKISNNEIQEFVIPKVDLNIQEKIAKLIQESFKLKDEAKEILSYATKAVEIAIEKNENEALQFLQKKSSMFSS